MLRKTLKDAVLDVAVRNFTFPSKTFSAYDITKKLRDEVNARQYSVIEFEGVPSQFGQEVNHSAVRSNVDKLYQSGFFDRTFNGTYNEYAVGNVRAPVTQTKTAPSGPVWDAIVKAVSEVTGLDPSTVTADKSADDLGFDDLDEVEIEMHIEETLGASQKGYTIDITPFGDAEPLRKLFDYIISKDPVANIIKPTVPTTVAVPSTSAPVAVPAAPSLSVELDQYIQARIAKGTRPILKNAQKAMKERGITTTVADIRDTAEKLGYVVWYNDKRDPFNQWTIRKR